MTPKFNIDETLCDSCNGKYHCTLIAPNIIQPTVSGKVMFACEPTEPEHIAQVDEAIRCCPHKAIFNRPRFTPEEIEAQRLAAIELLRIAAETEAAAQPKFAVNPDLCNGCNGVNPVCLSAACCVTITDNKGVIYHQPTTNGETELMNTAMGECPVSAISIL